MDKLIGEIIYWVIVHREFAVRAFFQSWQLDMYLLHERIGRNGKAGRKTMTKNKLSDLQNLLFAELERLDDEELTDEEVQKEVRRASAVKGVAEEIIKVNQLVLEASKTALEYGLQDEEATSLMIEQRTNK